MQIAIDGPAGVGKSTLAKALAEHLGIIYLDTGAMYRAVALLCSRAGVPAEEGPALEKILADCALSFRMVDGKKCLFDHEENLEEAIRKPEISKIVSDYAKLGCVREAMTRQQQRIAEETSVIMDGRDIGTVVLPEADYKFFLVASARERADAIWSWRPRGSTRILKSWCAILSAETAWIARARSRRWRRRPMRSLWIRTLWTKKRCWKK